MFIHCPFSHVLEGEERNDCSLIGQVLIKDGGANSRLLIGGDACCHIWRQVYKYTDSHKNLPRLDWDVFFIPHHGTYTFFTDKRAEEGRKEAKNNPDKTCMKILNRGASKGWLVCSSRPIREDNYDDDQPPHIEAVIHYRKRATDIQGRFVCLMEFRRSRNQSRLC